MLWLNLIGLVRVLISNHVSDQPHHHLRRHLTMICNILQMWRIIEPQRLLAVEILLASRLILPPVIISTTMINFILRHPRHQQIHVCSFFNECSNKYFYSKIQSWLFSLIQNDLYRYSMEIANTYLSKSMDI
jgi:hypothetical protein